MITVRVHAGEDQHHMVSRSQTLSLGCARLTPYALASPDSPSWRESGYARLAPYGLVSQVYFHQKCGVASEAI